MTKIFKYFLFIVLIITTPTTYGYWQSNIESDITQLKNVLVSIGSWLKDTWQSDYNLNIWEEEDTLNQVVPEDTIFSYNDYLYIVNDGQEYNPAYHGLPGDTNTKWAIVAIGLDWVPNVNYRVNSVVIRNNKWYIANYVFNTTNWFINDPEVASGNPWSEWREIEPLSLDYFDYLLGTTLLDYRANPSEVIYK